MINCIIVDDEPTSREILEKFIFDYPLVNLIESCKNAFEAAHAIKNNNIHLIFFGY